jgi:KDO2-lipid IV(A) lauroyltransferase
MVFLIKSILWLMSLMPAGLPYWLASRGAGMWMRLSPVKRHTTERNLERCYPQMDAQQRHDLVVESFRHYLCTALETGQNWYWPKQRLFNRCEAFLGESLLQEALASGKGLVILAPHFGAWEYLGLFLQKHLDIAILYKPLSHPGLEQALREKRRRAGGLLIPANASGLRQLYAHLRNGKGVGILPDQQPSAGQGRFAPFFGNQAFTGVLVPRLVQRTGCIVVACVCERLPGGRFRVHALPVDEEIHSADIDTALAAMNRAVERCIAVDPPQYLWSYRRFKSQPADAAPFYDFR